MKHLIILLFGLGIISMTQAQPDNMWLPTFSEIFSGQTSLNLNNWKHDSDWRNMKARCVDGYGCTNYDLRAYRTINDNLDFNNNCLRLIVKEEQITKTVPYDCSNPPLAEPCDNIPAYEYPCDGLSGSASHTYQYTAPAFIFSQKAYKFGYFQIECRIPQTNNFGIGANFWMWGHKCCGVDCEGCYNEIDIFEFRNSGRNAQHNWYKANNILTVNRHYKDGCDINLGIHCPSGGTGNFDSDNYANLFGDLPPVDFSGGQFHLFAVAWTPDKVEYYMDNEITHVTYNHPSDGIPIPMIIDINVYKDRECMDPPINTVLPYYYDVNHVKVWALNVNECLNDYSNNNCNLNNYINSVYKNIYLGNCTSLSILGIDSYFFRASDSIVITDEFIFDSTGQLLLDNVSCHDQVIVNNEN